MTNRGLYRLKPASQAVVRPLERMVVRSGVSADALTWLAVPVAALGGASLALSDSTPWLLLAVPFLAIARLTLNLLDGMVARSTGSMHPMGEMWNELGDRLADALFIGGLAFVGGVDPRLALGAVIAALLASYAGITSRAAGASRQYGGVMSKPGRMIVLGIAAPITFATGDTAGLAVAAVVILVGSVITLGQRIVAARRELEP
jgi:CDP-diacylglycerol--glycerol-3-phosphate 3-phosphatidyltransferase